MKKLRNFGCTKAACYFGYVTQAVVNNFAPLLFIIFEDEFALPLEKITSLITVNFTVQLCIDLLSTKLTDKLGYRASAVCAHFFAAAGLVSLAFLPYIMSDCYAGLLISVIIYAIGGGFLEVIISPVVEACPSGNKASAMGLLHSFYCWGAAGVIALSTLFMFVSGKSGWRMLSLLWAILPVINGIFFIFVPINTLTEKGGGMKLKELFSEKKFLLFIFLMALAGACELSMSQWASLFVEKALGVDKTVGDILGACIFALSMGLSRVIYANAGKSVNICKYITVCGALCLFSYILVCASGLPALSLVGCALCGFSVGAFWPGVFSIASEKYPKGGVAMFALLSLAGDFGCTGGPTSVGILSGIFSSDMRTGLAFAAVFPAMLTLSMALYLINEKKSTRGKISLK